MTLLERARAATGGVHVVPTGTQELALAAAFFSGEVTYGQVAEALGMEHASSVAPRMTSILRDAIKCGRALLVVR